MVDISMCRDEECPSRLFCYRFTATPEKLQSYLVSPRKAWYSKCNYFIPDKKKERGLKKEKIRDTHKGYL